MTLNFKSEISLDGLPLRSGALWIRVKKSDFVVSPRHADTDVDGKRGLADPAFLIHQADNHASSLLMSLADQMCNRKRDGLAGFHVELQRIANPISQSTDCRSRSLNLVAKKLRESIGLIVMKRKKGYRVKENPHPEEVNFSNKISIG